MNKNYKNASSFMECTFLFLIVSDWWVFIKCDVIGSCKLMRAASFSECLPPVVSGSSLVQRLWEAAYSGESRAEQSTRHNSLSAVVSIARLRTDQVIRSRWILQFSFVSVNSYCCCSVLFRAVLFLVGLSWRNVSATLNVTCQLAALLFS